MGHEEMRLVPAEKAPGAFDSLAHVTNTTDIANIATVSTTTNVSNVADAANVSVINTNNVTNNITIVLPAGSAAEHQAMLNLLKSENPSWALASADPADVPWAFVETFRGRSAPPELRNARLETGADGVERVAETCEGGTRRMPRGAYERRVMKDSFDFVASVPPDRTAHPAGFRKLQDAIETKRYGGSKRSRHSARDVARMASRADHRSMAGLDDAGKTFVQTARDQLKQEMDQSMRDSRDSPE